MRLQKVCVAAIVLAFGCGLVAQDEERRIERCGREIDWRADLPTALVAAEKARRPVLLYVFDTELQRGKDGSRLDFLDDYLRFGPFSDPFVVGLINKRFIPARTAIDAKIARRLKLNLFDIIPPAILFVAPDGRLLGQVNGIAVADEDLIFDACRDVLRSAPRPSYGAASLESADAQIEDGDLEAAAATLKQVSRSEPGKAWARLAEIYRRQRKASECEEAIARAREADRTLEGALLFAEARLRLRQGRFAEAEKLIRASLEKPSDRADEARYWLGALQFHAGRHEAANATWRSLTQNSESRWSGLAAASLGRRGPIIDGWQPIEWARGPSKTLSTREVIRIAIEYLVRRQEPDGSWSFARPMDFTRAGLTALCCYALHEWGVSCERGLEFLRKWVDGRPACENLVWDHSTALLVLTRIRPDEKEQMKRLADAIVKEQQRDGSWLYWGGDACSVLSATALLALWEARRTGIEVGDSVFTKGLKGLQSCKSRDGIYEYVGIGQEKKWGAKPGGPRGAAGRMALCRRVELLLSNGDLAKLDGAVDSFIENRSFLMRGRRVAAHSDDYGNASYFVLFGYYFTAEALSHLPAASWKGREKLIRDDLLKIRDADGTWMDDAAFGKSYGTAMALLTLKRCEREY